MEGGQMSGSTRTVLIILAFVAMVLGSFIWFIASWDASKEQSVTGRVPVAETTGWHA